MSRLSRRIRRYLLVIPLALTLAGCAATAVSLPPEVPARHTVAEIDDERIAHVAEDPWEGFNRRMYQFNYYFDRYLFLPVVSGYEFVTPSPVQSGVSNVFNNLGTLRDLANCILQLKGTQSLKSLGRFVTNSTLGLGGLFDPATGFGLPAQREDFGQTLGYWGVGTGPYLVLPVAGPHTVRSATGLAADWGMFYAAWAAIDPFGNMAHGTAYDWGLTGLDLIDKRHQESFRYYDSGYPFEYYMVRFLYRQKRELAIMK